jgi:flagellar basal-body rod protein FlgB
MITGSVLNDILGQAMQATAFRERIHAHNIANSDTPKFKKYEVSFEDSLRQAVDGYKKTGVLDLSRAKPEANRVHTSLSTRIDGNNVDINEENVLKYRNSVIYDMLANSYIANKQLHSIVYNGIK